MTNSAASIYPHVQHIRDALWRQPEGGLASVMVGAGFSRNADPTVIGARPFPLWDVLARSMAVEIGLEENKPRDPLQIAQMYASLRGRMELHRFVERQIPDAEYRAGSLHRRLLALRWADVFTTNYDTLLERAAEGVFDQSYAVIRSPLDIPMRCRPRLVKLHGTFGAGAPLIVTEEDYRRYPHDYPAFVNLVREAVMETVFVLIGFAGDDPNFLEWTGWVRDILGKDAPKIYLCGLLEPSPAVQALLADRCVTPVDLSPLFPRSLGEERHAKALDWLLAAFESGKPVRPLAWAPRESIPLPVREPQLPPMRTFTAFSGHPHPSGENWIDVGVERLREITTTWQAQRLEYPGWHIAPENLRQRVWASTEQWRYAIFARAHILPPAERLHVIHELCWRLDLCLSPLFTEEADKVAGWLETVNPFNGRLDLPDAVLFEEGGATDLADAWRALALHVIRTAREDLAENKFRLWTERLRKVATQNAAVLGELRHEQVLWHLIKLDLIAFRAAVADWKAEARQPLELARLASYAAEFGEVKSATELGLAALQAVRAREPSEEAISMEAWCCVLLSSLHWFDSPQANEWRARVEHAKEHGYNPWEVIESLRNALREVRPARRRLVERVDGFDAGAISRSYHFGRGSEELMPAFRLLRLSERAPCPLFAGNMRFFATHAAHAAVWLDSAAPFWSLATLLRAGAKPEVMQELFDRASIALIAPERVQQLYRLLLRVVTEELRRVASGAESEQADEMGRRITLAAFELLSRLALRIGPDLPVLLKQITDWMRTPAISASRHFAEPLGVLLARVIDALPDESMSEAVELLLPTPLGGELPAHGDIGELWPEPFEALWGREAKPPASRGSNWNREWQRLLSALGGNNNPLLRLRAFVRADYLHVQGWLTPAETDEFSIAIWSQLNTESGLPTLPRLLHSGMLRLPGGTAHNVEEKVKRRLLSHELRNWKNSSGALDINAAQSTQMWLDEMWRVFRHPDLASSGSIILRFNDTDAAEILRRLLDWWPVMMSSLTKPSLRHVAFGGFDVDEFVHKLCRFCGESLLLYLPKGNKYFDVFDAKLQALGPAGFSVVHASVGRLFQRPDLLSPITALLESDLVSADERLVRNAARAITSWRKAAKIGLVPPVPAIFADILVSRVALRREPSLDAVISSLVRMLEDDPAAVGTDHERFLLIGLERIAEETQAPQLRERYARGEIDRTDVVEGLHARSWAAALARTLATRIEARGEQFPGVLESWRIICATDPLPETRRAWRISP